MVLSQVISFEVCVDIWFHAWELIILTISSISALRYFLFFKDTIEVSRVNLFYLGGKRLSSILSLLLKAIFDVDQVIHIH